MFKPGDYVYMRSDPSRTPMKVWSTHLALGGTRTYWARGFGCRVDNVAEWELELAEVADFYDGVSAEMHCAAARKLTCDCGAAKCKTTHSSWCSAVQP